MLSADGAGAAAARYYGFAYLQVKEAAGATTRTAHRRPRCGRCGLWR